MLCQLQVLQTRAGRQSWHGNNNKKLKSVTFSAETDKAKVGKEKLKSSKTKDRIKDFEENNILIITVMK